MRSKIILSLISFLCFWNSVTAQKQLKTATLYLVDVLDTSINQFARDSANPPNNFNLEDVFFTTGNIIIQNHTTNDISVRFDTINSKGQNVYLNNKAITIPIDISNTFHFDEKGYLLVDTFFNNGQTNVLLSAITMRIVNKNGVPIHDIPLSKLKFSSPPKPQNPPSFESSSKCNCNSDSLTSKCNECDEFELLPKYNKKLEGLIYYDFPCKKFYKLEKEDTILKKFRVDLRHKSLHNNNELQLKIVRINRYLYNPVIKTSNINYESEMPLLLQKLFIPDSTTTSSLLALINNIPKDKIQSTLSIEDQLSNFVDSLTAFREDFNILQSKILEAYEICHSFPCCEQRQHFNFATYGNKLQKIKTNYGKLTLKVPALIQIDKTQLSNFNSEITESQNIEKEVKIINGQQSSISNKKTDLKDTLIILGSWIDSVGKLDASVKLKIKSVIDSVKTQFNQLKKDTTQINDLITKNKNKIDALQKNKRPSKLVGISIDSITSKIEALENFQKLEITMPSDIDIKKAVLFANNMVAQQNTFITPPWYVNGNRHEIIISIKPRDKSMVSDWEIMPYYNDFSYFDLPVIGKGFVSFSSGSFIAFAGDFLNKNYDWQKLPNNVNTITPADSSRYLLKETGYSQVPIGFSALVNAEWKVNESLGFGLSGGVGLTIEKTPRIAYLGGGSIFFGNLNQVAFTAGFAGMNVDKLNVNLQAVSNQNITYTFRDKISYYNEFKIGGFIAVTYTPFKAVKRPVYNSARKSAKQAKADAFDAQELAVAARNDANDAAVKALKANKAYTDAKATSDSLKTVSDNAATAATAAKTTYTNAGTLFTKDSADYIKVISKHPEEENAKTKKDASEKSMNDAKNASETAAKNAENAKKEYDKALAKTTESKTAMDEAKQKSTDLDKKAAVAEKRADDLRKIAEATAVTVDATKKN